MAEAVEGGAGKRRSGGVVWEVETGAAPASERPKAVPRAPRWESVASGDATYGRGVHRASAGARPRKVEQLSAKRVEAFKAKQLETLLVFRACEAENSWDKIHRGHYDWWMFPIDDGSKAEFNVTSEADIETLRSDAEWLEGYRDAVRLVSAAWGWDLTSGKPMQPQGSGMGYRGWDVRLAKICRSLFLFEEVELLAKMQEFAREVQRTEKAGASFFYGRICLDELLYFELPRRVATECQPASQPAAQLPASQPNGQEAAGYAGDQAAGSAPAPKKLSKKEQKEAADAFSDKLNSTPSTAPEADRFRDMDDRLKSMHADAFKLLQTCGDPGAEADLPPEMAAVMESWCYLHGAPPVSVSKCAQLAKDVDDFRLVGMSSFEYMPPEDVKEVDRRISTLEASALRARPHPAAEVTAVMLEWMQAALALQRWALEERKKPQE